MSKNHCARTYFWWVRACAPHLWLVHLPSWNFPIHLPSLQWPWHVRSRQFPTLDIRKGQSPDKFTGKPKMASLPTSSQESVKHKWMFTFTFTLTLRTIYKVNDTAQYPKRCWPATNNNAIIDTLLQHKEDNFLKMTVDNRSQQIRSEQMVDQISSGMLGGDFHL